MKRYNIEVKIKDNWMTYNDCYFIDSLDSYKIYMTELNNKFLVSESEIKNNKTFIGHEHSVLTGIAGMLCGMIEDKDEREPMLMNLKFLQAKVLSNQLDSILKGMKLVVNKKGGYFTIEPNSEYKIIEISGSKFTINDISVKKWWGGKHYYAKIGNIDVVDEDGSIKWIKEQDAYDMAIKQMNKLNLEQDNRIINQNL